MSQLKGNESDNAQNMNSSVSDAAKIDGTHVRKLIRVSLNPSVVGEESIFLAIVYGDQVKFSAMASRSSNVEVPLISKVSTLEHDNMANYDGVGFLSKAPSKDDMLFLANLEELIVQAASIIEKPSSYAGVISSKQPITSKGEEGSWMIRNNPIILKEWAMSTSLLKEELNRVPIWVKFYDVSFKVFDDGEAAKKVVNEEDGFQQVTGKKKKQQNMANSWQTQGWRGGFQPESVGNGKARNIVGNISSTHIPTSNPFDALAQALDEGNSSKDQNDEQVEDKSVDYVKTIYDESANLLGTKTGASTLVVEVIVRADKQVLFCSLVYANNYYVNRRALWTCLEAHVVLMRNSPWVLMGVFNAALNLKDHSYGGYEPNTAMREFKECVNCLEVMDINSTGMHFTWNQKPNGSNGVLKKIDRIIGNLKFNDEFPISFAIFQPYRISNYSPCVLRIPKGLKSPLRKLLHNQGNIHDRVNKLRVELAEVQKALDRDPTSMNLREDHAHYLVAFKQATIDEERFLRQKSKVEWLEAVDSNTAYFHKVVKSKSDFMVQDITDGEIEDALFSIGVIEPRVQMVLRLPSSRRCEMLWVFLETILVGFGFHPKMFKWIIVYVMGSSFSICVNGNIHGWFEGKRGLRQGHPPSGFVIMDALEEFKNVSGLVPSILPVRYLRVPLISSRLLYRDCKVLVERLESRISDWRNRGGVFRPFSVACAWDLIGLLADVVRVLCDLNAIPPRMEDIIAFIIPLSKGRFVLNIIARIVLAATTYYLWIERNSRLLKKKISTVEQVV
uniref:Uncharacterized protein n=1 Tax=Tanacetum cinerariifolium TaxID=118510 RepID=A0A699HJ29_TANCI|nr:hypothetical protein [Tanacetum cinerariifolium]